MSVQISQPILSQDVIQVIRSESLQAEQDGMLTTTQLGLAYKLKWFRMFIPKKLGGLEYSLPEVLRTEEHLAYADGSLAWVVTLCSGAGWFAGFLRDDVLNVFFNHEKVCVAGSGAATGTAEITGDKFLINGIWRYASGTPHATAITANCIITKNGAPLKHHDGSEDVRAFIFHPDEVKFEKNWSTMGMVATGSHGFQIKDLLVTSDRCFQISSGHAMSPLAVFQYPFLQLAETTLAVNYVGMAIRFLELCEEHLKDSKSDEASWAALQATKTGIETVHRQFYSAVQLSWSFCDRGEIIPEAVLRTVSSASQQLYKISMTAVQEAYPLTGLKGANTGTELNRVWRNLFTATQHSLFAKTARR